jgi:hypothetical protein
MLITAPNTADAEDSEADKPVTAMVTTAAPDTVLVPAAVPVNSFKELPDRIPLTEDEPLVVAVTDAVLVSIAATKLEADELPTIAAVAMAVPYTLLMPDVVPVTDDTAESDPLIDDWLVITTVIDAVDINNAAVVLIPALVPVMAVTAEAVPETLLVPELVPVTGTIDCNCAVTVDEPANVATMSAVADKLPVTTEEPATDPVIFSVPPLSSAKNPMATR